MNDDPETLFLKIRALSTAAAVGIALGFALGFIVGRGFQADDERRVARALTVDLGPAWNDGSFDGCTLDRMSYIDAHGQRVPCPRTPDCNWHCPQEARP